MSGEKRFKVLFLCTSNSAFRLEQLTREIGQSAPVEA